LLSRLGRASLQWSRLAVVFLSGGDHDEVLWLELPC
jgi:hypothetical protein